MDLPCRTKFRNAKLQCIYGKQMISISHRNASLVIYMLLNRLKLPGSLFLNTILKTSLQDLAKAGAYLVKE